MRVNIELGFNPNTNEVIYRVVVDGDALMLTNDGIEALRYAKSFFKGGK